MLLMSMLDWNASFDITIPVGSGCCVSGQMIITRGICGFPFWFSALNPTLPVTGLARVGKNRANDLVAMRQARRHAHNVRASIGNGNGRGVKKKRMGDSRHLATVAQRSFALAF
jgi:hypothetical protein